MPTTVVYKVELADPKQCPFAIWHDYSECTLERGLCPQLYGSPPGRGHAPEWCPLRTGDILVQAKGSPKSA